MARTAAKFTQADVARSLRAAKQADAGAVRLCPDGTILIYLQPEPPGDNAEKEVEYDREIRL